MLEKISELPNYKNLVSYVNLLISRSEKKYGVDQKSFCFYLIYLIIQNPPYPQIAEMPSGLQNFMTEPNKFWLNNNGEDSIKYIGLKRDLIRYIVIFYLVDFLNKCVFQTAGLVKTFALDQKKKIIEKINDESDLTDLLTHNFDFTNQSYRNNWNKERLKPILSASILSKEITSGAIFFTSLATLLSHGLILDDILPAQIKGMKPAIQGVITVGGFLQYKLLERELFRKIGHIFNPKLSNSITLSKFVVTYANKYADLAPIFPQDNPTAINDVWRRPWGLDDSPVRNSNMLRLYMNRELGVLMDEMRPEHFVCLMLCSLETPPPLLTDVIYSIPLDYLTKPMTWLPDRAHSKSTEELLRKYIKLAIVEFIESEFVERENLKGIQKEELMKILHGKNKQLTKEIKNYLSTVNTRPTSTELSEFFADTKSILGQCTVVLIFAFLRNSIINQIQVREFDNSIVDHPYLNLIERILKNPFYMLALFFILMPIFEKIILYFNEPMNSVQQPTTKLQWKFFAKKAIENSDELKQVFNSTSFNLGS